MKHSARSRSCAAASTHAANTATASPSTAPGSRTTSCGRRRWRARIGAPQRGQCSPALRWRDDLAGVHAALLDRAPDGRTQRAVQPGQLVPVELVGRRPGAIAACQSASSASRLPTPATACWSSSRAFTAVCERPRISRSSASVDLGGVRPQRVDVGVQPDPAQPALVEEPQRAAVLEEQREPVPLRLDRLTAAARCRCRRSRRPRRPASSPCARAHVDPAAHAEVDAEHRRAAGDLAPDRLPAPVGRPSAGARPGRRAAHPRCAVGRPSCRCRRRR